MLTLQITASWGSLYQVHHHSVEQEHILHSERVIHDVEQKQRNKEHILHSERVFYYYLSIINNVTQSFPPVL